MLQLVVTTKFKRDYKRIKKRGYNTVLLQEVLEQLCTDTPLDSRYKSHSLTGVYEGFNECHITPDWLLIYAIDKSKLILVAARTGTHADLFGM